ncbi:MAG: amidohydrolase [Vulcanibacillus sp.]
MRSIVINALIITVNSKQEIFKDGCMIFEDDIITYVGNKVEVDSNIDNVIDAKGNIIIPGLINTHGHSPMTLLRGYADDLSLQEWLEKKIWPIESKFKEEEIAWGSQLAIIEMLKNGITTFSDMYIYMDAVAENVLKAGIRATLSRSIIENGNEEEKRQKLKEAAIFTKNWNNKADGRITTMMAPHSIYTCSSNYIKEIVNIAKDLGVPIQMHIAENDFEVKKSFEDYGYSPIKHLESLGVFDNPTLVAHAVITDTDDLNILKNNNVNVSHNLGSNLKLGSGIACINEMLELGICVSLGTDGAASNNNLDIIEEMRLAALIHKGYNKNPKLIPAETSLKMGTIYGAKSLFLEHLTGSLEIGKKADFVIIDTNQAHFYPMFNPVSQIVYSASGHDINDVFINGVQVIKNKEILTLDEEKIYSEVKKVTKNWK